MPLEKKRADIEKQIIEMIRSGQYPEGSKLPRERDMAQSLGIGRNLLREAIAVLETLGMLEVRKREGIFVKSMPTNEIVGNLKMIRLWPADFAPQLMEVRQAINILAVDWAARRRTDEDVRKLRECFRNFEKTPLATEEDRQASARGETVLHSLIVDSAHNVILSRIYEGISFLMELNNDMMHMTLMNVNDGWVQHITEQHRRILDAIEARDSDAALREMKGHFEDTVRGLGLEKTVETVRTGL